MKQTKELVTVKISKKAYGKAKKNKVDTGVPISVFIERLIEKAIPSKQSKTT